MKQPFFSIIIPTYNRKAQLVACLQAITQIDYPRASFEVIVIDDGSEISPAKEIDSFKRKLNILLVTQPNIGPAAARNAGAARAKGEFLAFTDDDCKPDPAWLKSLSARFTRTPECCIGGRTINTLLDNKFSTASQALIDYLYSYYNSVPGQSRLFTSNNLALPAGFFHSLNGFDTAFPLAAAEDRDFCDRCITIGIQMIYAPEVLVEHAHLLTFRTFWRQHFNYGSAAFRFHRLRATRNQTRVKLEPLSFYLNLLRYPFLNCRGWRKISISGLLFISQAANAIGFFKKDLNITVKNSNFSIESNRFILKVSEKSRGMLFFFFVPLLILFQNIINKCASGFNLAS